MSISLTFRATDNEENQANEIFPTVTVKSVNAAWDVIRSYRDEAPEIVEGKILEVHATEDTDKSSMPDAILFKRNKALKLEFRDLAKEEAKEALRKEREEAKAASKAARGSRKNENHEFREFIKARIKEACEARKAQEEATEKESEE